ncbi:hypothetical protein BST19_19705 [Mycobacterium bouchedurhonense]|nr:hypothetical protein BST19_19705 [Mycobacterium bouchedurhonense]
MRYELVAPDGSVAAGGAFTDADAKAPPGGLIDQLATLIASRESEGLDGRERAKWLPLGTAERAEAAAVYGDEIVSDSWAYASEYMHNAFVARRDLPLLNGWFIRIRIDPATPGAGNADQMCGNSQDG